MEKITEQEFYQAVEEFMKWVDEPEELKFEIGNKPGQFYILDWLYEYWLPVKNAEGDYQVSNWGRVIANNYLRTGNPRFLKQSRASSNSVGDYKRVSITVNGKHMSKKVHRLVMEAHRPIENSDTLTVNHKDETPDNNCVWNLEWCDCKYNIRYGTGLKRRSENRISNAKGTAVLVYKNGEFYKEYSNVVSAAKDLNIRRDLIFHRLYAGVKSDYNGFNFKLKNELI